MMKELSYIVTMTILNLRLCRVMMLLFKNKHIIILQILGYRLGCSIASLENVRVFEREFHYLEMRNHLIHLDLC